LFAAVLHGVFVECRFTPLPVLLSTPIFWQSMARWTVLGVLWGGLAFLENRSSDGQRRRVVGAAIGLLVWDVLWWAVNHVLVQVYHGSFYPTVWTLWSYWLEIWMMVGVTLGVVWFWRSPAGNWGRDRLFSPFLKRAFVRRKALVVGGLGSVIVAAVACGVWLFPRLPVNDMTVPVLELVLRSGVERRDLEYLLRSEDWRHAHVRGVWDHIRLSRKARSRFGLEMTDDFYRSYLLSPRIAATPVPEHEWRGPLFELLASKVPGEASLEDTVSWSAAVLRLAVNRSADGAGRYGRVGVETILGLESCDESGWNLLLVAGLRSMGVPARLGSSERAEYWTGSRWEAAPECMAVGIKRASDKESSESQL